jgi:hypothetical protein
VYPGPAPEADGLTPCTIERPARQEAVHYAKQSWCWP